MEVAIMLQLFFLSCATVPTVNGIRNDYEALMKFKATSNAAQMLASWVNNSEPCSGHWYGVSCGHDRVTHLILESIQLSGNVTVLTSLDQLRVLSLKDNILNGSLPEMSDWKRMKLLFLSENQFSGTIPYSISALRRLRRLNLSNNKLSGNISTAFNALDRLLTLRLENNKLTGNIPSLNLRNLQDFNVSGNHLAGIIPASLSSFPISSFKGNIELCGIPFLVCQTRQPGNSEPFNPLVVPSTPSTKPSLPRTTNEPSKLSRGAVVAIVIGDFAILLFMISILLLYYLKKYFGFPIWKHLKRPQPEKFVFPSSQYSMEVDDGGRGNLVFIDKTKHFDLEELMRASAEMLGKGNNGIAYKAVLDDGSAVVVKRLQDAYSLEHREFERHMEIIGRLRHTNLVGLRAYSYGKDEKLLVYDYLSNGSLFFLLHGNRGAGRSPLDWTTRVKISLGIAKGLAYIHQECKLHGNIKSSNVLLDKNGNACISDLGLILMTTTSVVTLRSDGYRAPEDLETKKVSQRGDVYSFGVLLLEILTGKTPRILHMQGGGVDLPKWVQSVMREESTAEVFDLELLRYKNIEDELVTMLQIAMSCVSASPDSRPKMSQVVKMIGDVGGNQSPLRDYSDNFSTVSMGLRMDKSLRT